MTHRELVFEESECGVGASDVGLRRGADGTEAARKICNSGNRGAFARSSMNGPDRTTEILDSMKLSPE